jgi:hypothetical protein
MNIWRKFIYLTTEFKFPKFRTRAEKQMAAMASMGRDISKGVA